MGMGSLGGGLVPPGHRDWSSGACGSGPTVDGCSASGDGGSAGLEGSVEEQAGRWGEREGGRGGGVYSSYHIQNIVWGYTISSLNIEGRYSVGIHYFSPQY